jgi:hypothetical protein
MSPRRRSKRVAISRGSARRDVEGIVAAARPAEIHSASLDPAPGGMNFRREHVFMRGELRPPEYDRLVATAPTIRAVLAKASRRDDS